MALPPTPAGPRRRGSRWRRCSASCCCSRASVGAGSLCALAWLLLALGVMRRLCLRQIGGQTGDTAGALEQIGEIAVLLTAVAYRT